jgi:hypothetical protein
MPDGSHSHQRDGETPTPLYTHLPSRHVFSEVRTPDPV